MAVMLPNAQLTVHKRAHQFVRDEHGLPVAGATTVTDQGPYAGAIVEPDDLTTGEPYRLRVDPSCWELRPADEITDGQGRTFVVRTARLVSVPGNDAVDFIRVTADLDQPKVP